MSEWGTQQECLGRGPAQEKRGITMQWCEWQEVSSGGGTAPRLRWETVTVLVKGPQKDCWKPARAYPGDDVWSGQTSPRLG